MKKEEISNLYVLYRDREECKKERKLSFLEMLCKCFCIRVE